MDSFWTSKKSIKGLRHFVLLNKIKEKGKIFFLMVSVLDSEINLKINYDELMNSGDWIKGWLTLPKFESINGDYIEKKCIYGEEEINKIFINEDSLFNIS